MITNPSVILLDEPTSGLDSCSATAIGKLLQDLARVRGKTILATIHQPNSQAFFYFDRLILMQDGNIVFQGDASQSTNYFRDMGLAVKRFGNPADFFMRVLSVNYPKTTEDLNNMQKFKSNYNLKQGGTVMKQGEKFKVEAIDWFQEKF